jgi:glycosyltransferase involved in cell wall biosynthesis
MKICLITSWFPTKGRPYVAPFVYSYAKCLAQSGAEVSVISVREKGDEVFSKRDHIPTYRVNPRFPLFSILKLTKRIKPDVIHVHAPNFFGSAAIIAAKLIGIPIMATVYRAEIDTLRNPFLVFLRRLALRRFQRIVALSYFSKSLALKAGVKENKLSVIYNSCDEELFLPRDKLNSRKKLGLPLEVKIFLFVGNLRKIKGVYTLVESLNLLHTVFPDFLALIIGRGEEEEKLKSRVKEYGLADNIRFLDWLPQKQLSDFYNAADIFVLPSIREGHSIAMLEAMSSGLPILASDIEGNRESIKNGVNGLLFESGNEKMLSEKLLTLLRDSRLQKEMSAINPKIYLEKFSTRSQIEKYTEVYKSLSDKEQDKIHNRSRVLLIDNQGLSFYTSYLARGLSRYNDLIFFGLSEEDFVITGAIQEKRIRFHNIGKKLLRGRSVVSLFVARPLRWSIILSRAFLFRQDYDIVHIQGHLPLFFLFIPILKLRSIKICLTLHDVTLRPSYNDLRGKVELLYVRAIAQPHMLKKYSDSLIVHGSYLKNQLISEGINGDKIYIIPIFDYKYLLSPQNVAKSHHCNIVLPSDYILVFGKIKPYKGIDILINAAKIVRQRISGKKFDLVIAGRGDASYFSGLLSKDDYEYIHIHNEFIPNSEIPDLFTRARFLVLPYNDASQSAVTSLAYTFSKPVIASDAGSIPEYVEHGKTGFVFETGNVTQLANYILELLENEDSCIQMGKKAYKKLFQDMSLERCCEIIDGVYKRN